MEALDKRLSFRRNHPTDASVRPIFSSVFSRVLTPAGCTGVELEGAGTR